MTSIRAVAIGLLAGGAGALVLDPRGEGLDHVRLAMLTGLLAGQLLTIPLSLIGGVVWAFVRKGRPRPARLHDLSMGTLLMASGVLVVTQAWAVVDWLGTEPTPGGVGDPDGEAVIGMIAALSGCLMLLVGSVLLAHGVRSGRRPARA